MKKINLVFPFLKILFTKPSVILKSLFHTVINYNRKQFVINEFGLANGLPEVDLFDVAGEIDVTIKPFSFLYGASMPIDMALLKILAQKFNGNCNYMEIGTWRGESISVVAPVCNTCTSLSLGDDDMRRFGFSERMIGMQRFFSKDYKNIEHISGNSLTFDYSKLNRKFDLIFVDGDHSYDGVRIDTQNVFKLLKDENSMIVWHDYTSSYENIDWEVFAGIMAGAPADARKNIYHVRNTYCAIYTKMPLKTVAKNFPHVPDNYFEVSIKGKKI